MRGILQMHGNMPARRLWHFPILGHRPPRGPRNYLSIAPEKLDQVQEGDARDQKTDHPDPDMVC